MESNISAQSAVSIRGLTKRYARLIAVSGLDLEVDQGEILGFLGLNGAGKTTTIRVLLDLLRPTSGKASILGHDCQKDGLRARALTGYLPGEMGIYCRRRIFWSWQASRCWASRWRTFYSRGEIYRIKRRNNEHPTASGSVVECFVLSPDRQCGRKSRVVLPLVLSGRRSRDRQQSTGNPLVKTIRVHLLCNYLDV
ncbi:MAG: ATP-binding cassette domain-containing protein [Acidobacteriota bacterium]